jgi:hypothetical protein
MTAKSRRGIRRNANDGRKKKAKHSKRRQKAVESGRKEKAESSRW